MKLIPFYVAAALLKHAVSGYDTIMDCWWTGFLRCEFELYLLCWRIWLQASPIQLFQRRKDAVAGIRLQLWLLSLVKWVYFYSVEKDLSITMTTCVNWLHSLLYQWVDISKFAKIDFKFRIQLYFKGKLFLMFTRFVKHIMYNFLLHQGDTFAENLFKV